MDTEDRLQIASFGSRALAFGIDMLLRVPVVLLASFAVALFHWDEFSSVLDTGQRNGGNRTDVEHLTTSTQVQLVVVALLVVALWDVVWLRRRGATPGKLVVGIRVCHDAARKEIPWSAAVRRVLFLVVLAGCQRIDDVGVVFGVILVVDHLAALLDRDKKTLHDRVAGTVVVNDG